MSEIFNLRQLPTQSGSTHTLQFKNALNDATWQDTPALPPKRAVTFIGSLEDMLALAVGLACGAPPGTLSTLNSQPTRL